MTVIGVVGGIASGKSRVCRELAARGAKWINADEIAHEVLKREPVKEQIRGHWGSAVFRDGEIDRGRLAEAVFAEGDAASAERLNAIVHPQIAEEIRSRLVSYQSQKAGLILIDAPLLFETGLDSLCEQILFVDADFSTRTKRAALRGWNREELLRRQARQLPLEEKKARADLFIDNNGTLQQTAAQLDHLFHPQKT
ncbi:MAG: dephospho-CoA kinase [Thermoguttaceae bacterium]|nr:dephospho-CoA kinase [Thermoguttaceae bacterium]